MVCRTTNIPKKEQEAVFKLNEGVLGYTFLEMEGPTKYHMEFVSLSDENMMPASYNKLSLENTNLISSKLKGVLITAAFQKGSIGRRHRCRWKPWENER